MPITVNGEPLDQSEIRRQANLMRERFVRESPGADPLEFEMQIWEEARQVVIDRILLRQAAAADPDDEVRGCLETELKVQRFIDKAAARITPPKSAEISDYYRKNRDRFYQAEQVHASHIVKNVDEHCDKATALASIQAAAQAIAAGRPFGEVADEYSDCPGRGGDLGFFSRGEMVDEFEAVVFNLREGEISDIFSTPFGFHIAKLHEKRRAGIRPLPDVRAEIENAILAERRTAMLEKMVLELRTRADIRKQSANADRLTAKKLIAES
jgi:parvulin-like peptidyl-prolyl isomerase